MSWIFSLYELNIFLKMWIQVGKELRKEFNHQILDPWNPNTLFRGGIIHYYFDVRGLQDFPLCTIDFQHFL